MTTRRQIEANRRNAQKSTGPRSDAGKAASAANALVHGFTAARTMVLADEDEDAFATMRRCVVADLDPLDAVQAALAQRIAILLWRLERASRLEAEVFAHGDLMAQRSRERAHGDEEAGAGCGIDEEMRAEAPLAAVLVEHEASARAYERLARHESALQRALDRTLQAFTRLRAASAARMRGGRSGAARSTVPEPRSDAQEFRSTAPRGTYANLQNEANSPQTPEPALDFGACTPSPLFRDGPWSGVGAPRGGFSP